MTKRSNNTQLKLLTKYRFRLQGRGLNNERVNDLIRKLQNTISSY